MPEITRPVVREIIEDFANEILTKKITQAKPSKEIINFRTDRINNNERDVVQVPINLLRFRKNNGRIASDVLDYEQTHGRLDESDQQSQDALRKFLKKKDPEKTESLSKSILHEGQREPAIITCDGFLINGNRRKMVMDQLHTNKPQDDRFTYMKVVILPGNNDEGGAPTLLEIEQIENRYQLQDQGKAEYYGFDRALSIRRKVEMGLSLKQQASDDPQHAGKTDAEIKKAIADIEKNYLKPLACIDRYLRQFGREKQYQTISSGVGDPSGRWQAFVDYSMLTYPKFQNHRYMIKNDIKEYEVGEIEEAAFNIIRLRNIPDMPKVHSIMRELHKYCSTSEGKKEILNISKKVEPRFPESEHFKDNDQKMPLSREEMDTKWDTKNKQNITFHLKRASKAYDDQKEKETPIGLLDAALKKLTHRDMDLSSIKTEDYSKARKLTVDIQKKAKTLEKKIYEQEKKLKKLLRSSE